MREIKFKIWDKASQQMSEPFELTEIVDFNLIWQSRFKGIEEISFCDLTWLQFTGLQDNNDKDIYEGDILKIESEKVMVVTWNKKFASFNLDRDGWMFQHWFGESCNPEQTEVVGNIYENSELINYIDETTKHF